MVLAAAAALGLSPGRAVEAKPLLRDAVEREILRQAETLRKALLEGDAPAIEAFVSPRGIPCFDDRISRTCVQRDLRDRTSRLYAMLFDSEALKARHADAGLTESWREMLRAHPDLEVVVRFEVVPRQDPYAFPCAEFVASESEPPRVICFFRDGGRWWITDSLYECG
jgi:hypothetical protein